MGAPHLDGLDLQKVYVANIRDRREVRGRIAEAQVHAWLSQVPDGDFDTDLSREVRGYSLRQTPHGVIVANGSLVREVDFLYIHQGRPYVVEVKSGGLNGARERIVPLLDVAREVYDRNDVGFLLFFPFNTESRRRNAKEMETNYPVSCLNLGCELPRVSLRLNPWRPCGFLACVV